MASLLVSRLSISQTLLFFSLQNSFGGASTPTPWNVGGCSKIHVMNGWSKAIGSLRPLSEQRLIQCRSSISITAIAFESLTDLDRSVI